ncbi:hypothetical protein HAX54_007388 [Datura stramonium]|uniref:Uncharacterized protein n=1 Tax=Datura stramonium TaxID=4076 RepID=A0ABS8RVF1_DATST|nr:hypothetical protein [Datura stramonium]
MGRRSEAEEYLAKLKNSEDHYTWNSSLTAAGIHINVGDIIAIEISDRVQQEHTSLPCPVLVMSLYHDAGVPEIERIDKNIWTNQTKMGIDSQVVHEHAVEAQPSTYDTPVGPVYFRSPNSAGSKHDRTEQYQADLLQPDLSIFDAPLPEDGVFKDKRVETNEEELEEEQVTKEIDEEQQVKVAIQCSMDSVIARMVRAGPKFPCSGRRRCCHHIDHHLGPV